MSSTINGILATTTIASTGNYLPLTGGTVTGNINMSASIIPTLNNTYSLGSASSTWKDLYVGPGSLYVNGQEVVSTDVSSNVVLSASSNQSVAVKTYGTGDIELNPTGTGIISLKANINLAGGKTFKTSDDSAFLFGENINPYYNNVFNLGSATTTWNNIYATKFITTGGNSTQFVKGDGSLGSLSATTPLNYSSTTGTFTIQQSNNSQSGYLSSTDWNTFNNKQNTITNPVTGTGSSNRVAFWNSASSIDSTSSLYWNNTSGFLGIGNSNPQYKLDISGSGYNTIANFTDSVNDFLELNIKNTSTGTAAQSGYTATADNGTATTSFAWMGINNSNFNNPQPYNIGGSNDVSFMGFGNDMYISNANPSKDIIFTTGKSSAPYYNERLRIKNNGLIGIGTNSPNSLLNISDSTTTGVTQEIDNTGVYTGTGVFTVNANSLTTGTAENININGVTTGTGLSIVTNSNSLNSTNGLLYIANNGSSQNGTLFRAVANSSASSGLTLLTNGNLGIGTTAPSALLHIATSTANLTDIFKVSGTSSTPLIRVQQNTSDNLDVERVIIGQGGLSATVPDSLARDQLYVFGRINSSWNNINANFMGYWNTQTTSGSLTSGLGFNVMANTASFAATSVAGTSGMGRIAVSTTANAGGAVGTNGIFMTQRSLNPVFETKIIVNTTSNTRVIAGFSTRATGGNITADTNNTSDEAFFRKNLAGTNWEAVTRAGSGTENITTLATACTGSTACTVNTLRTLRVELQDTPVGQARFYIDGTLVATATTTAPASATRLGYDVAITNATTTAASLDMEYIRVWSDDPPTNQNKNSLSSSDPSNTQPEIETAFDPNKTYDSNMSLPAFIGVSKQTLTDFQFVLNHMSTTSEDDIASATYLQDDPTLTIQKYGDYFVSMIKTALEKLSNIFINVQLWVDSLRANKIETKELCVKKSDGTEFCANGDQLENAVRSTFYNQSSNSSNIDNSNLQNNTISTSTSSSTDSTNVDSTSSVDVINTESSSTIEGDTTSP